MEITEGDGYAILKWINPTGPNYKLTKVIQKTGSAPTSLQDGTEIYSGKGTTVQANDLSVNTKYFWSVFTTNNVGKVSDPVSISYTPRTDPNSRPYSNRLISTWNNTADVNNFCNKYNHSTGYVDGNIELSVGNKIQINDGTYNKTWIIAGFDLEHNKQASDGTMYDNGYGIFLIPEIGLGTIAWNSNNTVGGYMNSDIHKYINSSGCNSMRRLINDHLIQRNVLLSNSTNGTESNNYLWTKAYMTLMSVGQILGDYFNQSCNKYDDGEANYKLPLFNFIETGYSYFWTRCIYSNIKVFTIAGNSFDYHHPYDKNIQFRTLIMIR